MISVGIHYSKYDSVVEREDGSGLTIWVWLNDGGLATLFISFAELEQRAHQVFESQHAPQGMVLQ
jgi:hypothetical protein